MNFAFSEEQEELRRAVRQFLESKSPETEVRRLMETTEGYDPAVWKQMGQELMLQGLAIPEEYGGQGFTFIELGIVLEEMGRVLLCAPYFSSVVLAADAILDGRHRRPRSRRCCRASRRATRSPRSRSPSRRASGTRPGITMEANENVGGELHADGREDVRDRRSHRRPRSSSSPALAGTTGTDGISFFTVAGDADGLTRTPLQTMDTTRKQAKLEFDNVVGDAARQHAGRLRRVLARCSTRPRSRSPTR